MTTRTPIGDRIQSLRDTMGVSYIKPDPAKVDTLVVALWQSQHAIDYLVKSRNLTEETIRHFKLGFDTSTNAISIPVYKGGELVNIKYRRIDPQEKSKYIGESGAEAWLFNEEGVEVGRKRGRILVVEGEIDCMSAWQAGVTNVVSPSAGKDSFGVWLEQIDSIPSIYIAYDNDEGGKSGARKLADRLGNDKCFDINYPDVKDANEFLMKHTPTEFRELLKEAKPFIRQQFKTVGDIIHQLRTGVDGSIQTQFIPGVKFQRGWMAVISGRTNVGKTSYVMNIANDLASQGVGVLIMPFERGIESVGERFLHVRYKSSQQDFALKNDNEWDKIINDVIDLPVHFAMPDKEEIIDFIVRSKRYFDTKVVIVDHLDYLVRQLSGGNRGDAIADTLQQLKKVAEDAGVVLMIVSHIRKIERPGDFIARSKRPNIEDLKGSSSLYQDPEVVVMLSETQEDGEIFVDVLKNKGEMLGRAYNFDKSTGEYRGVGQEVSMEARNRELEESQKAADELWNS